MPAPDSTAWQLLESASAGDPQGREEFVRRYGPWIRAWLLAHWKHSPLASQVDDVVHDVFVECLKPNGVLHTALADEVTSFRAFLLGVLRNHALRHETRAARRDRIARPVDVDPDHLAGSASSVSRPLDREWARSIVREATARMRTRAERLGPLALGRIEILRLRFQEDLAIPEIAERLGKSAPVVHHQYAKARREFRQALEQVLLERYPGEEQDLLERCKLLMDLLG